MIKIFNPVMLALLKLVMSKNEFFSYNAAKGIKLSLLSGHMINVSVPSGSNSRIGLIRLRWSKGNASFGYVGFL